MSLLLCFRTKRNGASNSNSPNEKSTLLERMDACTPKPKLKLKDRIKRLWKTKSKSKPKKAAVSNEKLLEWDKLSGCSATTIEDEAGAVVPTAPEDFAQGYQSSVLRGSPIYIDTNMWHLFLYQTICHSRISVREGYNKHTDPDRRWTVIMTKRDSDNPGKRIEYYRDWVSKEICKWLESRGRYEGYEDTVAPWPKDHKAASLVISTVFKTVADLYQCAITEYEKRKDPKYAASKAEELKAQSKEEWKARQKLLLIGQNESTCDQREKYFLVYDRWKAYKNIDDLIKLREKNAHLFDMDLTNQPPGLGEFIYRYAQAPHQHELPEGFPLTVLEEERW
ncbi:hypothetical protein F5884DRAFT_747947 [Xylogone sp. PMI_703]|nr:hypothetical protein F5884DRAFT_747947 [Xylogone sp. PMI_703]